MAQSPVQGAAEQEQCAPRRGGMGAPTSLVQFIRQQEVLDSPAQLGESRSAHPGQAVRAEIDIRPFGKRRRFAQAALDQFGPDGDAREGSKYVRRESDIAVPLGDRPHDSKSLAPVTFFLTRIGKNQIQSDAYSSTLALSSRLTDIFDPLM